MRAGKQSLAFHCGHQVRPAAGHITGEHVAVARQSLGGAGDHQVGAQRQRLLPERRGGGVIDEQARTPLAADLCQPVQVDHIQPRIGRRLGQHHIGGGGSFTDVRTVRLDDSHPKRRKAFSCVAAHLVVAVGRHHEHRSRRGEHPQCGSDRGHAGTERQRRFRAFQLRQGRFQLTPAGIGAATVGVGHCRVTGRLLRRQVVGGGQDRGRSDRQAGTGGATDGFDAAGGIAVRTGVIGDDPLRPASPRWRSSLGIVGHSGLVLRPSSRATA